MNLVNNMPKKIKTREEKIRSSYRLQDFKLKIAEVQARRDVAEFGYLSKEFVRKDLTKTVLYSAIIIGLLFLAKRYFG